MNQADILVPKPIALRPPRFQPAATWVLLGMNILMFLLTAMVGGSRDPAVLLNFGASDRALLGHGQYWRLVMPMFLHAGIIHLAVNGLGIYFLGRIIEWLYGYGRFSLIYVLAGIGGSALSMWKSSEVGVGASGAL